jgi:membrane protease YdiL (CAAX protease family)
MVDGASTAAQTALSSLHSGSSPISRRTRLAGLSIVLAVAILPFLVSSTLVFAGIAPATSPIPPQFRYLNALVSEIASLGLVAYVLHHNRQPLSALGLRFRLEDVFYGVLIILAAQVLHSFVRPAIFSYYHELVGHWPPTPASAFSGVGLTLFTSLFAFINPVFEELIVRAFLISETTYLTGSIWVAVTASVLLQASYHLYQGLAYAIAAAFTFLLYSVFYVKTRRLWPIIVAHFWTDIHALIIYSLRLHQR